jgi:GTP-binding protein Era
METKAGYCAIIGKPNSGKSTLLNSITGAKLSIVTPKAQTTRKRVLGIFSSDTTQVIFLDTPGLLKPKYKMQDKMMDYVDTSTVEADVVTFIIDVEKFRDFKSYFKGEHLQKFMNINKPIIVLLNKMDLMIDKRNILPIIAEVNKNLKCHSIIPISALKNEHLDLFIKEIENFLPEGPFLYDPEQLSTLPERFFVSELIREVVFKKFYDEVPYSAEVNITEFKEREMGKWFISAEIIVERDTQKAMIIGKYGDKIKEVGELARNEIEKHLEMGIYLELFVKVRKNWKDNPTFLRSYGY